MLDVFQLVAQRRDEELDTVLYHLERKSTEGLRPGHLISSTPRYPSLPATYSVDERWE
jgi:hypothetical protein